MAKLAKTYGDVMSLKVGVMDSGWKISSFLKRKEVFFQKLIVLNGFFCFIQLYYPHMKLRKK